MEKGRSWQRRSELPQSHQHRTGRRSVLGRGRQEEAAGCRAFTSQATVACAPPPSEGTPTLRQLPQGLSSSQLPAFHNLWPDRSATEARLWSSLPPNQRNFLSFGTPLPGPELPSGYSGCALHPQGSRLTRVLAEVHTCPLSQGNPTSMRLAIPGDLTPDPPRSKPSPSLTIGSCTGRPLLQRVSFHTLPWPP